MKFKKAFIITLTNLLIFILLSMLPVLLVYSQERDEDSEIGRGLENRDKDNIYRDEIYLEGLLDLKTYYPTFTEIKDKKDEELLYRNIAGYYDEPVIPDIKEPYVKPFSIMYEHWYFEDGTGIREIKPEKNTNQITKDDSKSVTYYYKAFYNAKNSRLIRIEHRYKNFIQTIFIYNENHNIKYQIEFEYNKLALFVEYIYNDDEKLIRKNYYKSGDIVEYKTYQYHINNKLKFEKHFSYDRSPVGVWKFYNDKGYVIRKEKYENGIFKSSTTHQYNNKSGVEEIRKYFDTNEKLMKYWMREDKIKYYNGGGIQITWEDFFHNNILNPED